MNDNDKPRARHASPSKTKASGKTPAMSCSKALKTIKESISGYRKERNELMARLAAAEVERDALRATAMLDQDTWVQLTKILVAAAFEYSEAGDAITVVSVEINKGDRKAYRELLNRLGLAFRVQSDANDKLETVVGDFAAEALRIRRLKAAISDWGVSGSTTEAEC